MFKGRLFYLFVSLLVLVVLSPFLRGDFLGDTILYSVAAFIGLSTIYGLRLGKRALALTAVLAVLSLASGMVSVFTPGRVLNSFAVLAALGFYGVVVALLLRYIVKAKRVTADILFGSVCVYLLVGMMFSMLYVFLDIVNPASFAVSTVVAGAGSPSEGAFTYYSFVTLTTLGYGDIVPVSGYARTFAFLEAATGTLYVAILISRLVSMYITQSLQKKDA